jgi:threonine/homoserine/homoserine lactone efflux protein
VEALLALIGFSVVSSITPGPNNILLWASGARFGFRASLAHVLGTAVGIGAMAVAAAFGLAALIDAVPGLAVAMKIAASLYLLYLAARLAGSAAIERTDLARPLGLRQAIAFQLVNPKAWVFVLGAVTMFRLVGDGSPLGGIEVALTMALVVIPAAAIWAAAGDGLGRLLAGERSRRIVTVTLALILALTVLAEWR